MRYLTALPVYNELASIEYVLDQITSVADDVLVVDDGSTDGTSAALKARPDVAVVRHVTNRGYGAALRTAMAYAQEQRYDVLVTVDADGQHDPRLIQDFVRACRDLDIVSGSRYRQAFGNDSSAPSDRFEINRQITRELNDQLGLKLTDAFCGFKAYRVASLSRLQLTEDGYGMPLELWVQAALAGLRIGELAVPRIYLDANRTFGGHLDDPAWRLAHYRQIIATSLETARRRNNAWACDELACLTDDFASTSTY